MPKHHLDLEPQADLGGTIQASGVDTAAELGTEAPLVFSVVPLQARG
jgi:hypothetical protein